MFDVERGQAKIDYLLRQRVVCRPRAAGLLSCLAGQCGRRRPPCNQDEDAEVPGEGVRGSAPPRGVTKKRLAGASSRPCRCPLPRGAISHRRAGPTRNETQRARNTVQSCAPLGAVPPIDCAPPGARTPAQRPRGALQRAGRGRMALLARQLGRQSPAPAIRRKTPRCR